MTGIMPDCLLMPFGVFDYDEEQQIRETFRGAFSQPHESPEISLSNDDSSDRTFEIVKDLVANIALHVP